MTRFLTILAAIGLATSAQAVETTSPPNISLQLNALQQNGGNCRVSFVIYNGLENALERAAYEVALFDRSGAVDQLVTLDFKHLPKGKTKVLQFELPELDCANVQRVLINDSPACQGTNIAPEACLSQLDTTTPLAITFGI